MCVLIDVRCKIRDTAPQPSQQPLKDEQIERAWSLHADTAEAGKRRVAFARAIERAHGITGEKK
jgi:hypothetical protein